MKKVLIVGPLLSISGYGYHCRQLFNYFLNKKDYDVSCYILPWGNTSWFLNIEKENFLIDKIINSTVNINSIKNKEYDIGVHVQLPNEWNFNLAKKNICVSAFVETNICNYDWVKQCFQADSVIVPSEFTKKVIIDSCNKNLEEENLLKEKIYVIPEYYHESFDEEKDNKKVSLEMEKVKTSFNFLTIGQLTDLNPEGDRKNLINSIDLFCKAFKEEKDVGLIIKTSLGRSSTLDKEKTLSTFKRIVANIKKENEYPKIYILHGDMETEELKNLYQNEKIKGYYTTTKGEGYGLPLIEAARCELPIIATNWSGHLDFLGDNFLKLNYELKNIPIEKIDDNIFIKDSKWAVVKNNDVIKNLKKFKKNYKDYKKLAIKNKINIKDNFNKDKIFLMLDKLLKKVD